MRICDDLRKAVLQAAIQGKLTKQLPEDGDVADLLKQITVEKAKLIKEGKIKKEKPLPEIMAKEIPFDIPEKWQWCRLGGLCSKIGSGNTPPGGKNSNVYVPKGIKFIRSMNVYNDGLHYQGMVYISEELAAKRTGNLVYAKDILLNITGGSIGRCALIPVSFDLGSVNQHVLIIRNVNFAIREFIHICICSPMVQEIILKKAVGDKAGFSAEKANNLLIPLPPLAEQQRIVARVEELMARIDNLEKTETELEKLKAAFPGDMKAALLQAAMQGKLTEQLPEDGDAADLLEQIAKEKSQLIKEGKIKKEKPLPEITPDEVPFDIPKNWKWVRLGDCGFTNIGLTYKPSNVNSEGTIVLRSNNIQNGKMDYSDLVKVKMDIPENKICKTGDILICARNGSKRLVGKSAIIDRENMSFGAFMAIFRTRCNYYINYLIQSPYFRLSVLGDAGTTTINQLTQDMLKNFLCPLPPLAEQKRIVEKLDKLLSLCDGLIEN